jgi:hypothetical protein
MRNVALCPPWQNGSGGMQTTKLFALIAQQLCVVRASVAHLRLG